jgi:hypothetical protein
MTCHQSGAAHTRKKLNGMAHYGEKSLLAFEREQNARTKVDQ